MPIHVVREHAAEYDQPSRAMLAMSQRYYGFGSFTADPISSRGDIPTPSARDLPQYSSKSHRGQ